MCTLENLSRNFTSYRKETQQFDKQFAIDRYNYQVFFFIILPRSIVPWNWSCSFLWKCWIDIDENTVADSFIFLDKRRVLRDYASQYVYLKRVRPASLVELKNATIFILKSGLSAVVDLYVRACNGPITIPPSRLKNLPLPLPFAFTLPLYIRPFHSESLDSATFI